jgi:hypothetical protein
VLEQSHKQEDFVSSTIIDSSLSLRPHEGVIDPDDPEDRIDILGAFMGLPARETELPSDLADRMVYFENNDHSDPDYDQLTVGTTTPYAAGVYHC